MHNKLEIFYNKLDKTKYKVWFSLLFNLVIFILLGLCFGFYYRQIDDRTMLDIVSGRHTGKPDSHMVFVGQMVAYPLKWLYTILPNIPHYGILFLMCSFMFACVLCYTIINKSKTYKSFIINLIIYFISFLVLAGAITVTPQFTFASTLVSSTIICLVINYKKENNVKYKILFYTTLVLLSILAISIRYEIFLLSLPFLSVIIAYKLINKQAGVKWLCSIITIMVASVGLYYSVEAVALGEDYKVYQKYNDARSLVYDFYGLPDFEENQEFYATIGVDEETYNLYKNTYFFDLDENGYDRMIKIAEYQQSNYKSASIFEKTLNAFKQFPRGLVYVIIPLIYVVGLFVLFVIISRKNHDLKNLIAGIIIFLGIWASYFVLAYTMKFIYRVSLPQIIFSSIFFLHYILNNLDFEKIVEKFTTKKISKTLIAISLVLITLFSLTDIVIHNFVAKTRVDANITLETEIRNIQNSSDNIYICDISATSQYNYSLFETNMPENIMRLSNWTAFSPNNKKILQRYGYDSWQDLFKNSDNVYFVTRDNSRYCTSMNQYLKKHLNLELVKETYLPKSNLTLYAIVEFTT